MDPFFIGTHNAVGNGATGYLVIDGKNQGINPSVAIQNLQQLLQK